jgi:hypothetical protein
MKDLPPVEDAETRAGFQLLCVAVALALVLGISGIVGLLL